MLYCQLYTREEGRFFFNFRIADTALAEISLQSFPSTKQIAISLSASPAIFSASIREGRVALSVGHPRKTHSRQVIGCCLIPLEIPILKITRDELPMDQGVYWGCILCPLYPLLFIMYCSVSLCWQDMQNLKFPKWVCILPRLIGFSGNKPTSKGSGLRLLSFFSLQGQARDIALLQSIGYLLYTVCSICRLFNKYTGDTLGFNLSRPWYAPSLSNHSGCQVIRNVFKTQLLQVCQGEQQTNKMMTKANSTGHTGTFPDTFLFSVTMIN